MGTDKDFRQERPDVNLKDGDVEKAEINLRTLSPMQIVQRGIFCQIAREIGANQIMMTDAKNHVFVIEYNGDTEEPEYEVDYEFILFKATQYQMERLLACFQPKQKDKEDATESSIITEDKPEIVDKPKLFIP